MPRSVLTRLSLLLAATTALCPAAALAGPVAIVQPLPGLSAGLGISADGGTVVGYHLGNGTQDAVYWTGGGAVTPVFAGSTDASFTAISGDGSTMVGYTENGSERSPLAFRSGQATTLSTFASSTFGTFAAGTNGDGSVIIGTGPNAQGDERGIVWSDSNWQVATTIDPTDPLGRTSARGISGATLNPIVVGEDIDQNFNSSAFAWQNGVLTDIGPANFDSGALGISSDGSTIVGYVTDGTTGAAATWTGANYSTLTSIGTLGGDVGYAPATNADGSVVVGQSYITGNTGIHAFRYADGQMDDLNALLTSSGVNLNGVVLNDAVGLSADGKYIAANSATDAYLVYYGDGAGLTSLADQQASVDALARERQAVVAASDPYFGILTGDDDRQDGSDGAGVFGLLGSAVGGARGRWSVGEGLTLTGGIAGGTTGAGDAEIGNALYGAVALRYDSEAFAVGSFHPFVQAGLGEALFSNLSFTRPYGSGSGTGSTAGALSSGYMRAGLTADFDAGDQVELAGELGTSWLSVGGYNEAFSASNVFPAGVGGGSDRNTVARLSATWSHRLADDVDLALQAALATDISGSSGLRVQTSGFGTLAGAFVPTAWAEGGAHVTWTISGNSNLDFYAAGTAGGPQGNHAHIGMGFHITD